MQKKIKCIWYLHSVVENLFASRMTEYQMLLYGRLIYKDE